MQFALSVSLTHITYQTHMQVRRRIAQKDTWTGLHAYNLYTVVAVKELCSARQCCAPFHGSLVGGIVDGPAWEVQPLQRCFLLSSGDQHPLTRTYMLRRGMFVNKRPMWKERNRSHVGLGPGSWLSEAQGRRIQMYVGPIGTGVRTVKDQGFLTYHKAEDSNGLAKMLFSACCSSVQFESRELKD